MCKEYCCVGGKKADEKEKQEEQKYDKEYGDIKKEIEGIGKPDKVIQDDKIISNENKVEEIQDDNVRREAEIKNAQLYEGIVTEEMEGLEALQKAAEDIEKEKNELLKKQKEKPDEFNKEDEGDE